MFGGVLVCWTQKIKEYLMPQRNLNNNMNIQCLSEKLVFSAIYEVKWGHLKLKWSTLKVLLGSSSSGSKQIWIRSFKSGTIRLSMTIYSKLIGCQSSWTKKYSKLFGFKATFCILYTTRKYPLCGYILGVLTHTTAWYRNCIKGAFC